MIIDSLDNVTILDGNGNPFDLKVKYFNRYQSTIPHDIKITEILVKHKKTVGGFNFDRPAARCKMNYSGYRTTCTFEADFIDEGVFGFPQLIPVDSGITLRFEYGISNAYSNAIKKLISEKKTAMNDSSENISWREALEMMLDECCNLCAVPDQMAESGHVCNWRNRWTGCKSAAIDKALAALALSDRNCDIHRTKKAAVAAWFAEEITPRLKDMPMDHQEIPLVDWIFMRASNKCGENSKQKITNLTHSTISPD